MSSENPLCSADWLPDFSQIQAEHVMPAVTDLLNRYKQKVQEIEGLDRPDFYSVIAPLEVLDEELDRRWAPVAHLHGVKDSAALRKVYADAEEAIIEFQTELGQNRKLYELIRQIAASEEFKQLESGQKVLIKDALREFEHSGVALEEPQRSRFRKVQQDLSKLGTEFSEAVLDATQAWSQPVTLDQLSGLPQSALDMLAQQAKAKDREGYLLTLKGPVVQAVLSYADSRELREQLYVAYGTRASDKGPNAGEFDNSERLEKIMALRHESAQLLGFASAAHVSLVDKMAKTPERVLSFLDDLISRAKPVAETELQQMRDFAAQHLDIDDLQPWDSGYVAEKMRQRQFDFTEEDLKPYFPLPSVLKGMFHAAETLFNIRFSLNQQVKAWHADVEYFDVLNASGELIAGLYLDHYAREAKRGGAWMADCRARFKYQSIDQKPVAFLTCNVPPPTEGKPSLLTHDDVLTLFHEFGHGLHHILTEVSWPGIAGISGVEWDAVEWPSQFMENFCWKREALDQFALHYQTGERLPESLHQKMLDARHFNAGLFLVRQLEFALFDFRIHLEYSPEQSARVMQILDEVRDRVSVIKPPEWHRFPHAFTHIFAGGYAAGYYSYLWAEVLSADAFSAFEDEGIFNSETGSRYRQEILAVGGSRPALDSFVAFRGREPEPEAFLRSYGLVA